MNLEILTDNELSQLLSEAVELEDMRTFKQVQKEINRREKYDI